MEFGNLEIVEKTFTRKVNNPRGQDYAGIKFRRWKSSKKGSEGKIEETLTFSDKLFAELGLDNLALAQANTPDGVLLLVVEDQDEVKPFAKFMRQSYNKEDGSKQGKVKTFSNSFLIDALVEKKILNADTFENQYLALIDVTKEIPGAPSHVKGIYKIVVDEAVDEAEEEESTVNAAQTAPAAQTQEDNF